jgi:hypothetical protein
MILASSNSFYSKTTYSYSLNENNVAIMFKVREAGKIKRSRDKKGQLYKI